MRRSTTAPFCVALRPASVVACVGLAVGLLAGCGEQDTNAESIDAAARTIANANAGVGAPPRPELVRDTYEQVRSKVTPVKDSSNPEQSAAASILIAETQLGEAAMQAVELASAMTAYTAGVPAVGDQAAQIGLDDVRHELARLARLQTEIDLANAFTVSDEIAALEQQVAERDREQAIEQSRLDDINASIAEKETAEADKVAESAAERAKASELKLRASRETSNNSVDLFEQARLFDRSADGVAFEVELLRAELDQLRPDRDRLVDQVERLASERRSLTEAIDRLRTTQREARARGSEAAAAASVLERRIEDMLFESGGLTTERISNLTGLAESVADAYGQAASSARSGSALRVASNLAQGRAQAAIGSAHNTAALALEQAILLLSDAASQGVGGDRVPSTIQSLEAQRVEAFNAAGDAFEQAADLLGGNSDDAQAAYTELAMQSRGRAEAPAGSFDQAAFDRAQEEARAAREAEFAADPIDDSDALDPREAALQDSLSEIAGLLQQGELLRIAELATFEDQQLRSRYMQIAGPAESLLKLDRATFDTFGQTLTGEGGHDPSLQLLTMTVDGLDVLRQEDTAIIYLPGDAPGELDPWTLTYDGSQWRLNGESMADQELSQFSPDQLASSIAQLNRIGSAASAVTQRVQSGEFESVQEVLLAFGAAMEGG